LLTIDLFLHSVDGRLFRCREFEVRRLESWIRSSGGCGENLRMLLLEALQLYLQSLDLLLFFLLVLAVALVRPWREREREREKSGSIETAFTRLITVSIVHFANLLFLLRHQ
jgi:hypothetical protein